MATANHLFCEVRAIGEALRDDALAARGPRPAVARGAFADLNALHFFSVDQLGHFRGSFWATGMSPALC